LLGACEEKLYSRGRIKQQGIGCLGFRPMYIGLQRKGVGDVRERGRVIRR